MDGNPKIAIPFLKNMLEGIWAVNEMMVDEAPDHLKVVTRNMLGDGCYVAAYMVSFSMNEGSWYEKVTGQKVPTVFPVVEPNVESYIYKIVLGPAIGPHPLPSITWKKKDNKWFKENQDEEALG